MVGRWALAKPWIFREFAERRDIEPDPEERLAVVRRYVELCREQFGDDETGRATNAALPGLPPGLLPTLPRRGGPGRGQLRGRPRDWGEEPRDELERWLCRADLAAVEALCDWLVDGAPRRLPPPATPDGPRAVRVPVNG